MARIRTVVDLRQPRTWYAIDAADTGIELIGRGGTRAEAIADLVRQLSLSQLQAVAINLARAATDLAEVRDIVQPELHRRGWDPA